MATPAPPGLYPIFLRGVTCDKFGLKTGEGVNDVVDYKYIPKEDITKDIQVMGKMSDFEPAKKVIDGYHSESILLVVDREQKYGETFLICYTDEARDEYLRGIMETQEALREQLKAEMQAEEDRRAAEFARLNVVYEDKPITPRPWVREGSNGETEHEISLTSSHAARELISIEVSRPKRFTKQKYQFTDKTAEVGGVAEFRSHKDPGFKALREADCGIQVAPTCAESGAQTTWYRSVNKAIQYEAASIGTDTAEVENLDAMLAFLERATVQVEHALQQNESVDIFNETFRLLGDDDVGGGAQADNELRELKNFADPTYSKFKALAAIDWVPKVNGMVAVSAVRNISFDQRIPIIGQTHTSYVLLWDFRLLVKPLILMQSNHEIFTFRFNRIDPNLVAGGCITGQVVLWETSGAIAAAQQKNNRGASSSSAGGASVEQEEEDLLSMPVSPKYISHVDFSHKKCVADLFWLPPTTQINYRGRLVGDEHLDGKSYQFVTVAGDGLIMVWDIRYEQIFNDELRHIGRAKHVPTEKSNNKESGGVKPLWGPIFKAHLKRLEGVGELSLCKLSPTTNLQSGVQVLNKPSHFGGDSRSQFTIATEEGDVIFTDLSARKAEGHAKEEEDEEEAEFSCVKWITVDHPRPSVCLQESPFFPQIVLSVSDWNFHIWKVIFLTYLEPLFSMKLIFAYFEFVDRLERTSRCLCHRCHRHTLRPVLGPPRAPPCSTLPVPTVKFSCGISRTPPSARRSSSRPRTQRSLRWSFCRLLRPAGSSYWRWVMISARCTFLKCHATSLVLFTRKSPSCLNSWSASCR